MIMKPNSINKYGKAKGGFWLGIMHEMIQFEYGGLDIFEQFVWWIKSHEFIFLIPEFIGGYYISWMV